MIRVECYVDGKPKVEYKCKYVQEARMWARRFIEEQEPEKRDQVSDFMQAMEALGYAMDPKKTGNKYGVMLGDTSKCISFEQVPDKQEPMFTMEKEDFDELVSLTKFFNCSEEEVKVPVFCEMMKRTKDPSVWPENLAEDDFMRKVVCEVTARRMTRTINGLKEMMKILCKLRDSGMLELTDLPF